MFLYNLQILFFMRSIYFNLYPVLFHFFSKVRLILKTIVILNTNGCRELLLVHTCFITGSFECDGCTSLMVSKWEFGN